MMLLWWVWTLFCLCGIGWALVSKRWVQLKDIGLLVAIVGLRQILFPLQEAEVIGHSTRYLDVYHGQVPQLGDSSFYPSMQILWWFLGRLSFGMELPQLWSAVVGGLSILLLSTLTDEDANQKLESRDVRPPARKDVWLLLWLLTLPEHLLWSTSLYNIIFPFFAISVAYRALRLEQFWVLNLAMALAISWRLEMILFWGFLLRFLPFWNHRILLSSVWGTLCTLVLFWGIQIPGEGEYVSSIPNNWWLLDFYSPYYFGLLGLVFVFRQSILNGVWIAGWILFHHLVLSTFNDFATRHLLPILVVMVFVWVQCPAKVRHPLLTVALGWNLWQLWMAWQVQREQWFEEQIRQLHVPTLSLLQAQNRECAWIVEEEPFANHAIQPTRSHFNLLASTEVLGMITEYSCIDWCKTRQDFIWTELGIRDRALRIQSMYTWQPVAVINTEGQRCALYTISIETLLQEWGIPESVLDVHSHSEDGDLTMPKSNTE